jgi:hypothetical protein
VKAWISGTLGLVILSGCAAAPKGKAVVTSTTGNPGNLAYLTAEEIQEGIRKDKKDDADKEIEIRMVPKGGKLIYKATTHKFFALGEQENTTPFLSVVQDSREIAFCDESDFRSESPWNRNDGTVIPKQNLLQKENELKFECPLKKPVIGVFDVRVLDADKKAVETYTVSPR